MALFGTRTCAFVPLVVSVGSALYCTLCVGVEYLLLFVVYIRLRGKSIYIFSSFSNVRPLALNKCVWKLRKSVLSASPDSGLGSFELSESLVSVTASAWAVGSVNGWRAHHRVVSVKRTDGHNCTFRSLRRA